MNITKKLNRTVLIAFVLILTIIGNSTAQVNDQVKDELFGDLRESIEKAEIENASLYSPKNYEDALKYYHKALKDYEKDKSLKAIRKNIDLANENMQMVFENIELAKITLDDLIKVRGEAIKFEIDKRTPRAFEKAEKKFKAAALQIEKGRTKKAKSEAKKAERAYKQAVTKYLRREILEDAEGRLKQVKKNVFKDSYKKAENELKRTEEFVKYREKTDFDIAEIIPEVYNQISNALAIVEIDYPKLVIGDMVFGEETVPEAEPATSVPEDTPEVEIIEETKIPEKKRPVPSKIPIDKNILNQENEIVRLISPETHKQIKSSVPDFERNAFAYSTPEDYAKAASATVQELYDDGKLGAMNIDKASFLLIKSSVDAIDRDITEIKSEIIALEDSRLAVSDFMEKLGEYENDVSEDAGISDKAIESFRYKIDTNWIKTENLGFEYIRNPKINLRSFDKIEMSDIKYEMQSCQELLNSLNGISEINSLRLQMAMDRRAKYVSTLSNIMKKISQTQEDVIRNIK